MTVKELKDLLAVVDENLQVKPYVVDEKSAVKFWYFELGDIHIYKDGVYIELK